MSDMHAHLNHDTRDLQITFESDTHKYCSTEWR